jgi:excisionase family DNA binding protein
MEKRLFTVREAARYLAISPVTLYHWIGRREVRIVRLRRRAVRLDRQDLDDLVMKLKSRTVNETERDGALQARQDMVAELRR